LRSSPPLKTAAWISGGFFDAPGRQKQVDELDKLIAAPGFWSDNDQSSEILRRKARLEEGIELDREIARHVEDGETLIELAGEGESIDVELPELVGTLDGLVDRVEFQMLLGGENDSLNGIVTIHPGAGGTEAQDWAEMLYRMYVKWAEKRGYTTEILDYQAGEEAGLKSVTFLISGDYAFGYLFAENGVHRLVRISPFDSAKRRHTSFASVSVCPEIDDKVKVDIDEKDLRIDTYRSSGAGGQHVNVTDSAVRITHVPTGTVVQCQNERSQHKNRAVAMKILRARMYELEMEKKRAEAQAIEDNKMDNAWGSQIRSYVLAPYRMVKDHRTKVEVGDVDRVLDGGLDGFIKAFLQWKTSGGAVTSD
jgi:peptide chain release factor 2